MKPLPWEKTPLQRREQSLIARGLMPERREFPAALRATVEPVAMPPEPQPRLSAADFARAEQALRRANTPLETVMVSVGTGTSRFWEYLGLGKFKEKEPDMAKTNGVYDEYFPAKDGWQWNKGGFSSRDMTCCGLKEHHGIQNNHSFYIPDPAGWQHKAHKQIAVTPYDYIVWAKDQQLHYARHRPYYIFTEATPSGTHPRGDRLVAYIEEHKLGTVAIHGPLKNDNSGNKVTMFVWMVDNPALQKHKPVFTIPPELVKKEKKAA